MASSTLCSGVLELRNFHTQSERSNVDDHVYVYTRVRSAYANHMLYRVDFSLLVSIIEVMRSTTERGTN